MVPGVVTVNKHGFLLKKSHNATRHVSVHVSDDDS